MKGYIVAAAAGLVLLIVAAVMVWTAKFPAPISIRITLPAASGAASSTPAPSTKPAPAQLSADEQGLGTPEAFLAAIYKHYEVDPAKVDFSTLSQPSDYYDPDLVALMAENNRLYEGYIGAIEADPICQCQDWSSIKTTLQIVKQDGASAAVVATLTQAPGGTPYTVRYQLVRIDGHWRIRDLGSQNYKSLRAVYQASNADARKHPAETSSSA